MFEQNDSSDPEEESEVFVEHAHEPHPPARRHVIDDDLSSEDEVSEGESDTRGEDVESIMRKVKKNNTLGETYDMQLRAKRAASNKSTTKKERDACFKDAEVQTTEPFAPLFDEQAMANAIRKEATHDANMSMMRDLNDEYKASADYTSCLERREADIGRANDEIVKNKSKIRDFVDDKKTEDKKRIAIEMESEAKLKQRATAAICAMRKLRGDDAP